MLTADAFMPVPGEMERVRAGQRERPENGAGSGRAAETARNGDSFPEMLETIQDGAMDRAETESGAFRAEPAGKTVDADVRSALKIKEHRQAGKTPAPSDERNADILPEDALLAAFSGEIPIAEQAARNVPQAAGNADAASAETDVSADGMTGAAVAEASFGAAAADGAVRSVSAAKRGAVPGEKETASEASPGEKNGEALRDDVAVLLNKKENSVRSVRGEANAASGTEDSRAESVSGEEAALSRQEKNPESREAAISVVDLRRRNPAGGGGEAAAAAGAQDADVEMHLHLNSALGADAVASPDASFDGGDFTGGGNSLRGENGGIAFQGASQTAASGGTTAGAGGTAAASFAERLSAEIRANSAEFVRAGQIVLRDGTEGVIRLTLHPETLGSVRIRLEMSADKKLSGKITVSSQEAWDAFSDNMDGLVRSFSDEGFDTAGFDLSWAGGESGEKGMEGKISAPFYAARIPDVKAGAESSDNEVSRGSAVRRGSLYAVDVFA